MGAADRTVELWFRTSVNAFHRVLTYGGAGAYAELALAVEHTGRLCDAVRPARRWWPTWRPFVASCSGATES